jgi:hypothetical protein
MTTAGSRLRQIGWLVVIATCLGLFLALSFRVHAVKSEVRLAERQIIALKNETLMLETEFQARANQRQLAEWNAVEFGYEAPRADQYLEGERQLASFGLPRAPGAPAPIRVARADIDLSPDTGFDRPMVSPLTGQPVQFAVAQHDAGGDLADAFGEFLAEASPVRTALAAEVNE